LPLQEPPLIKEYLFWILLQLVPSWHCISKEALSKLERIALQRSLDNRHKFFFINGIILFYAAWFEDCTINSQRNVTSPRSLSQVEKGYFAENITWNGFCIFLSLSMKEYYTLQ